MNWPTPEPRLPDQGWYADPQQQWMWRWWDGQRWTEVRSPMHGAPPARDPHSFSAWFEQSTSVVKAVVRRVGLVVLAVHVACWALVGVVIVGAFTSADGEEIRRIIDLDRRLDGSGSDNDLSRAERDRLRELFEEIARTWLPWMLLVGLLAGLATFWTLAVAARVANDQVRDETGGPDSRGGAFVGAGRRVPVVLSSALVVTGLYVLVMLGPLVPMIAALAAGADGAIIAVTAIFGFVAALVLVGWIGGRLSLTLVIAALGGHGLGLARSWDLTRGHFWGVVGRVLVAGLIASAVTAPLSFLSSFAFVVGAAMVLVSTLLVQAAASAASVLVTIPAQVVLVEHLRVDQQAATAAE